jgi:hypothetical protein
LRDQIKETENAIAEKNGALATSLRIIVDLDETVRVYKLRIANLEMINKLLLDTLTHITLPAPTKNSGTNKKETK